MKKQTIANIFLGFGIVWFIISVKGWFFIWYALQHPGEPLRDFLWRPMAFDSLSEQQGYIFSEEIGPLIFLVPALIYYFKVRHDVKKSSVAET